MVYQLTFEQPTFLWLLFSLPLLVFTHLYFMHHAKKKAIRFGNFHTIERVTGEKMLTKNIILLLLRCLLIAFLVLGAAGTMLWHDTKNNMNDIAIVIDTSASMTTQDMDGSRIDAAKAAAEIFVNRFDTAASISVVQFSGLSEIILPPTNEKEKVIEAIKSVKLKTIGGSDIAGAMITGTNLLAVSSSGKAMILMTDGVETLSLYEDNPVPQAIAYAQKNHVVIHTIGVGSHSGESFIPGLQAQVASFDEQNLQVIANATGGTYSWAQNPQQLDEAYNAVIKEGGTALVPLNLSLGFVFVALIILFIEWGLINTRYRLLP